MPYIHSTSAEAAAAILENGYQSIYNVCGNHDELIYAEDSMIVMLARTGRHDEFLAEYEEESDEIHELAARWSEEFEENGQVIWLTTDGEAWSGGTALEFTPPPEATTLYRKPGSVVAFYVPGDKIPAANFRLVR